MKQFAWLLVAVFAVPLIAKAETVPTYQAHLTYDRSSHNLVAHITETQVSPNACDLIVTRFEYMPDMNMLSVELEPDFCAVDVVGYRRATVTWQMPMLMRSATELALRVNKKVLGPFSIHSKNSKDGAAQQGGQ
ncbi:MAG: hypothetical protein NDI61_14460 [Bdellovibrionaceae bacterium]|nr:hypothetical protein [Pseudobdellovibrionaceae bacterium]